MLNFANDSLPNNLKGLHEKFVFLENEKDELQNKYANLKTIVLKFSKGEENLNKILSTQKASFNKEGISFNLFNKKEALQKHFC